MRSHVAVAEGGRNSRRFWADSGVKMHQSGGVISRSTHVCEMARSPLFYLNSVASEPGAIVAVENR
jgi:hypothetical protein